MKVQIKLLTSTAKVPKKATVGSAGYDIYADQDYLVKKGEVATIPTGVAISFPKPFKLEIVPRSGLAFKNGITVVNSPGTVDSDYCLEIKVGLIKHTDGNLLIKQGDRIAQMILVPIEDIDFEQVNELNKENSERTGGFGSTGNT